MSVFSWISNIFSPVSDLVDELHFSGEEEGRLRNKLAEIEAKVATRTLELQSQIIEANAKIATAEQEHGNWLSKSWRPLCSLGSFAALVAMGTDVMVYNQFLATIFGSFLGIYTGARSWEKRK